MLSGFALGAIPPLSDAAQRLVVPLLMLMLTMVFIHVPLRTITEALRDRTFTATSLTINFVWTPILDWALGGVFLAEHPDLRIGVLTLAAGRSTQLAPEAPTALGFATLARNSPVALAVASAAFPDRPLVAVTLVAGALVELPVLALLTQLRNAQRRMVRQR